MPTEAITYYRSTRPALAAFEAECNQRREVYEAHAEAFEAEFPGYSGAQWITRYGADLVGLYGEACPGPHWVKKARDDFWSPSRRTKAGNELWRRLNAICLRWPSEPGMPATVRDSEASKRYCPSFEKIGEEHWMGWGCRAELVEADPKFDPAIWERAKASAYHLAREAAEEKAEVAG